MAVNQRVYFLLVWLYNAIFKYIIFLTIRSLRKTIIQFILFTSHTYIVINTSFMDGIIINRLK